jgi:hypothetical protein
MHMVISPGLGACSGLSTQVAQSISYSHTGHLDKGTRVSLFDILTPLSVEIVAIQLTTKEIIMAEETKTDKTKETKKPGPGEPGYYNPPTPPPAPGPQNPPPPQTAAATGDAPPEPPKPEATTPKAAAGGDTQANYDDMTVAELKDLAHKRGIDVHSDMLKDDIIKALKKSDKK